MSVPPVVTTIPAQFGESTSMLAPEALTSDTAPSIASSAPLLLLLRQPVRQRPRADQSSWGLASFPGRAECNAPQSSLPTNETLDVEVVLPSVNTTVASRPYFHLVDPAADTLPLHSTPMDDVPGTQTPIGNQYISPIFDKPHCLIKLEIYNRPVFYTIIEE